MKGHLYDIINNSKEELIRYIEEYICDFGPKGQIEGLAVSYDDYITAINNSLGMIFTSNEKDILRIEINKDYKNHKYYDFIIEETRKHLYKGIKAPTFLGFIKYCRKSYIKLIMLQEIKPMEKEKYIELIEDYFDILELCLCEEWTRTEEERKIEAIEYISNTMTYEKSKYIKIFESSTNPTLLLDPLGKIDCINLAARKLLSELCKEVYGDKEYFGKELLILKEELKAFWEEDKEEKVFEKRIVEKDVDSFFQVSFKKMRISTSNLTGVIVILNDITEIYKIQEATKQLATIVESSDDAIIGMDLKGMVTNWNKGAENIYGYTQEEMQGQSICKIVREERVHEVFSAIERIKSGVSVEQVETVDVTRKGEFVDVLIKASSIRDNSGKIMGISTITRDITKRKRAEAAEKVLTEAIEYERIKNEFFANLSHEFRTPINVMYSSLQMIELYVRKGSSIESIDKYTKVMKQNCYRLLRLIRNLIDITRMDVGFFKLNLRNHDIISIVENITLSIVEYCTPKNINLVFDTQIEEKIIACDPDMIERIMLNLFSNAIKFIGEDGNIDVNIHEEADNVVISVKDDGRGIDESKLDMVFERFMQADKSLSRENEGSGIGLAIVKELVELHGGRINVISKPGQGAEFIIRIPSRRVNEQGFEDNISADNSKVEHINIEFSDIYM